VQAIAFGELSKPARAEVIAASLSDANVLHAKYSSIGIQELAVEIAVCSTMNNSKERR
jgi:hypothetical protein